MVIRDPKAATLTLTLDKRCSSEAEIKDICDKFMQCVIGLNNCEAVIKLTGDDNPQSKVPISRPPEMATPCASSVHKKTCGAPTKYPGRLPCRHSLNCPIKSHVKWRELQTVGSLPH